MWYCDQPYGVNKIKTTVKEICSIAGFEGKYTNHSLRATCASRMYAKNIPEQIIKEVTGHRSDCVRTYKRTSDELREEASRTLSVSDPCSSKEMGNMAKKCKLEEDVKAVDKCTEAGKCEPILSIDQMLENVIKTKAEKRRRNISVARSQLSLKKGKRVQRVRIDVNVKFNK